MTTLITRFFSLAPEQQALVVVIFSLGIVGMALYLAILLVRKRRWR
jgi:hypothetical protein